MNELIREKVLDMLSKRDYPKTCCPSEIARALKEDELQTIGCEEWRAAMDPIREEAWRMRFEGIVFALFLNRELKLCIAFCQVYLTSRRKDKLSRRTTLIALKVQYA